MLYHEKSLVGDESCEGLEAIICPSFKKISTLSFDLKKYTYPNT